MNFQKKVLIIAFSYLIGFNLSAQTATVISNNNLYIDAIVATMVANGYTVTKLSSLPADLGIYDLVVIGPGLVFTTTDEDAFIAYALSGKPIVLFGEYDNTNSSTGYNSIASNNSMERILENVVLGNLDFELGGPANTSSDLFASTDGPDSLLSIPNNLYGQSWLGSTGLISSPVLTSANIISGFGSDVSGAGWTVNETVEGACAIALIMDTGWANDPAPLPNNVMANLITFVSSCPIPCSAQAPLLQKN